MHVGKLEHSSTTRSSGLRLESFARKKMGIKRDTTVCIREKQAHDRFLS